MINKLLFMGAWCIYGYKKNQNRALTSNCVQKPPKLKVITPKQGNKVIWTKEKPQWSLKRHVAAQHTKNGHV